MNANPDPESTDPQSDGATGDAAELNRVMYVIRNKSFWWKKIPGKSSEKLPLQMAPRGREVVTQHQLNDLAVDALVFQGEISVDKVPVRYLVENQTAKSVGIEYKERPVRLLVLSPFSKRKLRLEDLRALEYRPWEKRGLIRISEQLGVEPPTRRRPVTTVALILLGLSIGVLLGIPLVGANALRPIIESAAKQLGPNALWWLILISVVVVALLFVVTLRWKTVWHWISGSISLIVLIMIGLGTPLLLGSNPSLVVALFIIVASILPGVMFYLFDRLRYSTLRESFLRDVLRLDPNFATLDDAEALYGTLCDEIQGGSTTVRFLGGIQVSLLISTGLMALGWSLVLLAPSSGQVSTDINRVLNLTLTPFTAGFLGAYFFALNLAFRRYARGDLGAKTYSHIAIRLLITMILVWLLPNLLTVGQVSGSVYVAFAIGIFPETALRLLQEGLRRLVGFAIPSLVEDCPLTDLEGISLYDRVSMLEEGIENIENLAHHNLIGLMLRTRIPTQRLVSMVDQAILYLHARGSVASTASGMKAIGTSQPSTAETPRSSVSALECLRCYGIRAATDLEEAYQAARQRNELDKFLSLLDEADAPVRQMQVIFDVLQDDDWMVHLRHWYDNQVCNHICTLDDFSPLKKPVASTITYSPSRLTYQLP